MHGLISHMDTALVCLKLSVNLIIILYLCSFFVNLIIILYLCPYTFASIVVYVPSNSNSVHVCIFCTQSHVDYPINKVH